MVWLFRIHNLLNYCFFIDTVPRFLLSRCDGRSCRGGDHHLLVTSHTLYRARPVVWLVSFHFSGIEWGCTSDRWCVCSSHPEYVDADRIHWFISETSHEQTSGIFYSSLNFLEKSFSTSLNFWVGRPNVVKIELFCPRNQFVLETCHEQTKIAKLVGSRTSRLGFRWSFLRSHYSMSTSQATYYRTLTEFDLLSLDRSF